MKRYVIGLTGNIACGKSTVARMLRELCAEVIDADSLVHELMKPGSNCWHAIVQRFGQEILRPDGTIDRAKLGGIVFRDPQAMAQLEAILHPAARQLAEERIALSNRPVVVLEAIKLIEAGWSQRADSVWVVTCLREQQIERLIRSRGLSRPEAELRVNAQPSPEEKLKHADVVIDNSGTLEETRRQVVAAWRSLTHCETRRACTMRLRITTLAENSATKPGTLAEHGLSMLIEMDGLSMMLDTGQTNTAVHNARVLGIDLSRVRCLVLSHGHQDHTGGLKDVLAATGEVEVYAHSAIWRPRYAIRKGEKPRYSGIPFLREHMEALGATFRLSDGPLAITPEVMTTGYVPRRTDFEKLDADLKVKTTMGWQQDEIPDDQALLVKTPRGLVVLLGCAHSGIVNSLLRAREVSGEERILAVLGGTHLGFSTREQLERTVEVLKGFGIEKLGVSHCTGLAAAGRLAQEFGDAFFFNNVGTLFELSEDGVSVR